jgi:hypothetical protein
MNQPMNPMGQQVAPIAPKEPVVTPWLLIVFIIVLLGGGGYLGWYYWSKSKTPTPTTPTTTTPTTTTTTPTTTATSSLTYTNATYGFTMTFPTGWEGYKMKPSTVTGSTATYYVNFPTKDATATGNSTADKGYFSPFAVSVYTLDQWTAAQATEGPKDTLIVKNDKYAFGWSQSNGTLPTDFTKTSDIATIIASFKLTTATTPTNTTTNSAQ